MEEHWDNGTSAADDLQWESEVSPKTKIIEEENESEECKLSVDSTPADRFKNPFHSPALSELYKIVTCISKNSPGSVYLVKAKESGRLYSLKKIECHDESDARTVFYEEMELKKLDHPYVSSYKDFFITYDQIVSTIYVNIISEYFPDGNLRKFIKDYQDRKEVVPEQVVKKMLGEILEALVYLHDNHFLHRNIKPNNIFRKQRGAMVLGDLGVASIMGDMRTNTRQTFQGTVFMAPEIGQQHHDIKTDLYSVGGVLLNILTTSVLSEQEFYKKLGEIKEQPQALNVLLDLVSHKYSKPMINIVQMLLRHKHSSRPSILEFIKSGFVQECMAQADVVQYQREPWQKELIPSKSYFMIDNRGDLGKILEYITDTAEFSEECLADGLSALADVLRDNDKAHKFIDQKARTLISLAMWNNIFNKDIQIAGCYVLSNLVVFAQPDDVLFSPDVITIVHKTMANHEYSPEVQLAAANLILALSADEKASQTIVQLGAIQDVLKAMRHARYHATLNAMCCMVLWSLSINSDNLKVAVKENAARDVSLALNIHKVSPDVCEAAAAALVSLLLDDGCYDIFSELDSCGSLVAAIHLHTKNEKVVKNCCKVLATAVEANEDCAYRFISNDLEDSDSPTGMPTIMKAYKVHKDNADVVESIIRLLLELSQYDDIAVEMHDANVGPLLLAEVYKRYSENKAIMGPVEKALERLDAVVMSSSQKILSTSTNQGAVSKRTTRFAGEVPESCRAMLRTWRGSDQIMQLKSKNINHMN